MVLVFLYVMFGNSIDFISSIAIALVLISEVIAFIEGATGSQLKEKIKNGFLTIICFEAVTVLLTLVGVPFVWCAGLSFIIASVVPGKKD